ncbi:FLOT1 protein, partial [Alectura lathami]|nr:FLOT1 protein [Alectura lathami]
KDRQKFSEQVFKVASSDLVNMGISVVSYTLKDIHDDQVTPRGTKRGASTWGSGVTMSPCPPQCPCVPRITSTRWGRAARRRCSATPASGRLRPRGTLASATPGPPPRAWGPTVPRPRSQVARTKQQIEEERAQVQVVERAQQTQLQEHEIGRRERELEATVRKPAEAERYRLERLAEAER